MSFYWAFLSQEFLRVGYMLICRNAEDLAYMVRQRLETTGLVQLFPVPRPQTVSSQTRLLGPTPLARLDTCRYRKE